MSQENTATHWPPKSPHEALLSTPGGRDRLRRIAERASPSPSPSKRLATSALRRNRANDLPATIMSMDDGEEEDDEETLQLQLQEIQARLKLKRLQKKSKQGSDSENDSRKAGAGSLGRANSISTSSSQSRMAARRDELLDRPRSQGMVHVPVSPVRRTQPTVEQRSPGRVLLGIDKGLRGQDISLKRAPSLRRQEEGNRLAGPFLQRTISQTGNHGPTSSLATNESDKPKSFSERMAAVRSQETEKEERQLRVKKSRSTAFDIDHEQMQNFKEKAVELPDLPRPNRQFSRDEIVNSYSKPRGVPRSQTVPDLQSVSSFSGPSSVPSTQTILQRPLSQARNRTTKRDPAVPKGPPDKVSESEASQFEPFSAAHLSKRIIPHQVLTRTLSGKKTFLIPDLLREVKSPDFSLPEIEEDIVVIGIIAQKSEPRAHAPNGKTQTRGKYMVVTLTDLKWELDLFLFDSGFEKFWKMTTGTIIAVLNPGIMPPSRGRTDTGKFSLTVNSEADTILEIGTARDLGFCKSVKKDGKTCDSWVDKRHTEFCDYHVNETLKKTSSKRMEVNTMSTFGARKFNSQDMTGRLERKQQAEKEKYQRYDRESGTQIFIGRPTPANLLDNVDFDADPFHRGSKEERIMRQVRAKEKERELAKKLGAQGGGLGADYMRRKEQLAEPTTSSYANSDFEPPPAPDAAALGLLSGKAHNVALSPIKRKRERTNTMSSTAAMGWGGDLTKKLGNMKNGESLLPPVKKKTRLVTEKGIRLPGRESFGGDLPSAKGAKVGLPAFVSDDDDDLDIV